MDNARFERQVIFILEIEKLKTVFRRTYVLGTNRHENDAEHSWQLAMMAFVLNEYANEEVNALRILKMVLIHDIVEIDAGDTFCYDDKGALDKADRERAAAQRLFGLLPDNQAKEIQGLWEEFEGRNTPEAKFANGLDRLMPLLHNYHSEGKAWKEHGITKAQVMAKNKHIADGSTKLWEFAHSVINKAVDKGYLSA